MKRTATAAPPRWLGRLPLAAALLGLTALVVLAPVSAQAPALAAQPASSLTAQPASSPAAQPPSSPAAQPEPAPRAAAPAPAPAAAPQATEPQRIVVEGRSASEDEQRRNALLGTTIVGREELDRYGDTSALDVLQRLPGITLDGEVPRLRGMGGGYTLILINGEPAPPGFSLDTLAPADIERIEVIKGPSAEFGGVAGTINVILRTAPKLRQREFRSSLGYRALGPQGSASLSWGDRVSNGAGEDGALSFHLLSFHLPLSLNTWANAADLALLRSSRLPLAEGGEERRQQVLGRDESRGRGINFTPKLDFKLSGTDTLGWQSFVQGNRSDNRSRRDTLQLAGPPLRTVYDRSSSEGEWQMLRSQLQWVQKAPSGTRLELKATAQSTLSRGQGDGEGRDVTGAVTVLRASSYSVRETTLAQGGRWRQPLFASESAPAPAPAVAAAPAAAPAPAPAPVPAPPSTATTASDKRLASLPAAAAASHTLVLGWDVDQRQRRELRRGFEDGIERLTGTLGVPFTADIRRAVVFVQDEMLPSERWSLLLGLRGEALWTTTTGPGQIAQTQHSAALPVLQLRHAWDDQGRQVLRLGLARSLRLPDIGLLLPRYSLNGSYDRETANTPIAADSAGNPQLRPENALALELAFEQSGPGGAVFSAGLFHRQIHQLIRRRVTLETVAEASLPRWVSRPGNLGKAHSSGLELEIKGRAADWMPGAAAASPWLKGLQVRASLSLYRSRVEQLDDPDARLEGQAPWGTTAGFDHALPGGAFSYGANVSFTPGFSTQQTDRQRVWRGRVQRVDAYALWRIDRQTQLRLAGNNLAAADQFGSQTVTDLDGYAANSQSQRQTRPQISLSWVQRF